MCRIGLNPPSDVRGLLSSFGLEPSLKGRLRQFLQEDVPAWTDNKQILQDHQTESKGLREAERWLMEMQGRFMNHAGGIPSDIKVMRTKPKNILPFWKTAREILSQEYIETSLKIDGSGSISLIEFPDKVRCDHLSMFVKDGVQQEGSPTLHYWKPVEKEVRFEVDPTEIIFRKFIVGKTFHARLRVRNAGESPCPFDVRGPRHGGVFAVCNPGYRGQVLAPGLSVEFRVSFACRDREDHYDSFTILAGRAPIVVPLCAKHEPPTLQYPFTGPTMSMSGSQWDGAQPVLVDCGKCLVGDQAQVKLRLTNAGPIGRFFFLSELEWISQTLSDLRKESGVVSDSFSLQPSYFGLERREQIDLTVSFLPACEGSHASRLYVLCDNITVRPVDLLGEAIFFSPDIIRFQGFEKNYNVLIQDEMSAQYCIYIGAAYKEGIALKRFTVTNHSELKLKYRWVKVEVDGAPGSEGVVQILPAGGVLYPSSCAEFTAAADTTQLAVGRHWAVFNIYIDNVPLAAFPDKNKEEISPSDVIDGKTSIRLATMEVWVDIMERCVLLLDNFVHYVTRPNKICRGFLFVSNLSTVPAALDWEEPAVEGLSLAVSPASYAIPPCATKKYTLTCEASAPGQRSALLRAAVRGSRDLVLEVLVLVEAKAGSEQGRHLLLQAGPLAVSQPCWGTVFLPPGYYPPKTLSLNEFKLHWRTGEALLERTENFAYVYSKSFMEKSPPCINFTIKENTEGMTYNLLELQTQYHCYFLEIVCDFHEPLVSMQHARVALTRSMDVNCPETVELRLRNHKMLPAEFSFFHWFGQDEELLELECQPSVGLLQPGGGASVTVTLAPRAPGFVSDVFIPCHVKGVAAPLITQVVCHIRTKECQFSWQAQGQLVTVVWPEEECSDIHRQYPSETFSKDSKENLSGGSHGFPEEEQSVKANDTSTSADGEEESESSSKSIPYEKWPIIGGRYYGTKFTDKLLERHFEEIWTCEALNEKFKKLSEIEKDEIFSFFSKNALCFEVTACEESTKTIEILNLSHTDYKYNAKVNFFKTKKNPIPLDPVLEAELQVFGSKTLDVDPPELIRRRWNQLIRDGAGLGIQLGSRRGLVRGREQAALSVTVFARAWGCYFDSVRLEVGDLPTFHLPVFVRATQNPVYFTFSPGNINPILRFPSMLPNTMSKKKVLVQNSTFLPVTVAWCIFSKRYTDLTPNRPAPAQLPEPDFTVQFEFHPQNQEDFCRLHLTDYYGVQKYSYFRIKPRILTIPAYSKAPVEVKLNTSFTASEPEVLIKRLEATAVGTIYVHPEARSTFSNRRNDNETIDEEYTACFRSDGYDIPQIRLRLETKIEVPNIRLVNTSKEDMLYKVRTRDIFCVGKPYTKKRKYLLKNFASRQAYLKLLSSCPFRITKVLEKNYREVPATEEVVLGSQEFIEIEITLVLSKVSVMEKCDDKNTYLDYRGAIRRDLACRERDLSEHLFPLYLELVKPCLVLSANPLDFGAVDLGESYTLPLSVISKLGDEPFHLEIFSEHENPFEISPMEGVLTACRRTNFTVVFTPRNLMLYRVSVQLVTTTPGFEEFLTVLGRGGPESLDEEEAEGEDCWGSEALSGREPGDSTPTNG